MAVPTIAGTPTSGKTTPGTDAYTVSIYSGSSGDLILVKASRYIDTLSTADSGWTTHGPYDGTSSIGRYYVFEKVSDGTETVLNISGGGSYAAKAETHEVWRVAGQHASSYWYEGTNAQGTSTTPDPPSVTPSAGSDDYLVIASYGCDGRAGYSSQPTGYTALTAISGGAFDNTSLGSAYKGVTGTTEDPSTFTISGSRNWGAETFAIRGASGGSFSQSVSGTLTPAGALTVQVSGVTLAGTITPAGAYSDDGGAGSSGPVSVAGTITPDGNLGTIAVGFADGAFVGSISPAGTVSTSQLSFSGLMEGYLVMQGAVAPDQQQITLSGTLTPAGAPGVPTNIEHALAGTITPAGAVNATQYVGITLLLHSNVGSD